MCAWPPKISIDWNRCKMSSRITELTTNGIAAGAVNVVEIFRESTSHVVAVSTFLKKQTAHNVRKLRLTSRGKLRTVLE